MRHFIFDVEATNCPRLDNGKLDTDNSQAYDLGGMVIDDEGNDYKHISLVNGDVFFDMKEAMKEAFFANKIPQYMQDIWAKEKQVVNTWEMWSIVNNILKEYDIHSIIGHNVWFDINTLNSTMRYQTKSKKRYFFPYDIQVIDTMVLANKTICKDPKYINFCRENNYMTNHPIPQPRRTAEILWRYLTNNNSFEEEHTGLADVEIERKIYAECLRRSA